VTHAFSTLFLPFSMTLDNFPLGVAYGVKAVRMKAATIVLITLLPVGGTLMGMLAGRYAGHWLSAVAANWIGSAVFVALGVWTLWDTLQYKKHTHTPEAFSPAIAVHTLDGGTPAQLRHVSIKESLVLALALSINNLGGGIGAGVSGLNLAGVTLLTFLFGYLLLILGYRLGAGFKTLVDGKWPGVISGFLMIGLGIYEVFV
jgi:putative sporulation protein YtaF